MCPKHILFSDHPVPLLPPKPIFNVTLKSSSGTRGSLQERHLRESWEEEVRKGGTSEVLFYCKWYFIRGEGILFNTEKHHSPSDTESKALRDHPLSILLAHK